MSVGIGAALFWALETILLGAALSSGALALVVSVTATLLAAALHDVCSAIYLLVYLSAKGQIGELIWALRSSGGKKVMAAALLGGPVGMSCYLLAIQLTGAGVAASVSALYPAIGAVFSAFFLGERLRLYQTAGLTVSVFGTVWLGASGEGAAHWIGLIPALLCALCWGSEAVISSAGMDKSHISSEVALQIRQLTSALTYCIVILPFTGAIKSVGAVMLSPSVYWLTLAALAGTLSYLCYYRAIRSLGPSKAMALNITYTVWVILLEAIAAKNVPSVKPILCAVLISVGSILSAYEIHSS